MLSWEANWILASVGFPVGLSLSFRQGMYFALNDYFKKIFGKEEQEAGWMCLRRNIAAGGIAGVTATLLLHPMENARMLYERDDFFYGKYDSMLDVYSK